MSARLAILYLTHQWGPVHVRRYRRLQEETRTVADCFVLFQAAGGETERKFAPDCKVHAFDPAALPATLGYPYLTKRGIVPGCPHYPLVDFCRQHSYPYYWLIENDVEFSGNWNRLVSACAQDPADLVAAHVVPHEADPGWIWWRSLAAPQRRPLDPAKLLRAFFPVYRISRQGLSYIDCMLQSGWRGHYEALIPTLLGAAGMSIRDIQHFGPLYLGTRQDPPHEVQHLDQLSTLRWRPPVSREEFVRRFRSDVIFHPIKQAWTFNGNTVDDLGKRNTIDGMK